MPMGYLPFAALAAIHLSGPQGETARSAEGRLAVRLRERGVQSDPLAEAAAEARLMRATCVRAPADGPRERRGRHGAGVPWFHS